MAALGQGPRCRSPTGDFMIVPVRCFSCGGVIGDKYEGFTEKLKEGKRAKEALDEIGVERYCCRRMLLSHRDFIDEVIKFQDKGAVG